METLSSNEKPGDSDLAHSFEDKMGSKVKILSEIKEVMFLKNHSSEFARTVQNFGAKIQTFVSENEHGGT